MTPLDAFRVPLTGTKLVEASAGTGKTHAITSLFLRLVLEEGLGVEEILVVTFTDAATAELRDRIRRRLRAAVKVLAGEGAADAELAAFVAPAAAEKRVVYTERAGRALRTLDLAAISTIHSFCFRMLQEHAFESGARFDLGLAADTALLVDDVANDYWSSKVVGLSPALFALRAGSDGFDRACAQKIATAIARRPVDTPVLPLPPSPISARATDARELALTADEAFANARARWQADGAKVRALVKKALPGLKANMVSEEKLAAVYEALDAFFASEALPMTLPHEALEKLTPSALQGATKKNHTTPHHPLFDDLETLKQQLGRAKANLVTRLRRGVVDHVRSELPRRKEALRAQGFEDLLFSLDAALDPLRNPRAADLAARIAGRFRAALIDEFQDTDPVQYRIFQRAFDGRSTLLLVGDPKQSIYAFRGADVFSYVDATKQAERHVLETNRRSDPSLVRAVNAIFEGCANPFRLEDIAFHPVKAHAKADRIALPRGDAAFEIAFLPREGEEKAIGKGWLEKNLPRLVAAEIASFLRTGAEITEGGHTHAVRPGDVAVLTRTNKQAAAVQAELRALGIPTALASDESVFASAEAAEVELLLSAVLEPTSARGVRSALATTVAGWAANDIAALETDEKAWDDQAARFRAWQAHWDDHGFIQAFRRMLSELGAEARLLALVDGERRMTNLLHLGELLHGVAVRDRLGKTALVRWLRLTRARVADGENVPDVPEATELRLESDAHAVKLLTIHKSKGLEFPVVYCPFLWGGRDPKVEDAAIDFHDPEDGFALKIDVVPTKESASLAWKKEEVLAENQRLLYVALTRAKHRCAIAWGAVNQAEACALAYTLHGGIASFKERDDASLKADLLALAKRAGGTIRVRDLDRDAVGTPWIAPDRAREGAPLAARVFARERVDRWFRIGSFTGLVSGAVDLEALARDHDEVEEDAPLPVPETSGEPVVLHAFPRGAKAGTTMHEVLEVADFADAEGLRGIVASKLGEAGYADAEWGETLTRGLSAMLATPLGESGMTLASVPRAKRADELEFVLPVCRGGGVLSAGKLADAFEAHASGEARAYAARLRALRFLPLRGFLKGFIDLVFEHEGRFYVVDYKSNHLGDHAGDYRREKLAGAMTHHDYFLQYHLYVVAVHRWLASRVRGYDYDARFGGVHYLFVRGMSAAHPVGCGVFSDRPSRALVEALSEVLDG